tara:strand:- start:3321 stop:3944 length:624 start_codon:yes stop_codon:yes gene_type:complete
MKNNIDKLNFFFQSKEKELLINQVNEIISSFYIGVIKHISIRDNINISLNGDESKDDIGDLFGRSNIDVYNLTNSKKIEILLQSQNKKIILTDYKNYKKFNKNFLSINGYECEKDITTFIKNELNIDNMELINFCKNYPVLLFSETSKYLINNDGYINDQLSFNEKNHILELRKSIFSLKKDGIKIKTLFSKIKTEAIYKKLNFLIY